MRGETLLGSCTAATTEGDEPGAPATTASATTLAPGARIGRYVVVDVAGRGGMGLIYLAHDPELGRRVALKLVLPRSEGQMHARERFLREAQALARLAHPNVVAVHQLGVHGDGLFIAMEFVEGRTLRAWLADQPRHWREIVEVFAGAGRGLAAAHNAGLVHRDFKPENVLVGVDGRPRVLDFGLVRAFDDHDNDPATDPTGPVAARPDGSADPPVAALLTETALRIGTPAYMAPEQHLHDAVDARADQFAFCVALHEALYGVRPFAGETYLELASNVVLGKLTPPATGVRAPAPLRAIVLRGLRRQAADRYPSMVALLEALERVKTRRSRLVAVALALVMAVAMVAVVVAWQAQPAVAVCRGGEDRLAGVWDARVRAATLTAFTATKRPYAADTFARVAAALDERTTAWLAIRRDACEATRVRGEQTEAMMDLRMRCLDHRLGELRALTALFSATADPAIADQAMPALLDLPGLAGCSDAQALLAAYPLPDDPVVRAKVDALQIRIDELAALARSGKDAAGVKLAKAVVDDAARLGWPPVHAQALYWLGRIEAQTGGAAASITTFERAMQRAAEARDDALLLRAGSRRVYVLGYDLGRSDEALKLAAVLDPVVTRAGDPPDARADLLNGMGVILWSKGAYAEAQAQLERALPLAIRAFGPDQAEVARIHSNLGNALNAQGHFAEARSHYETGLHIHERTLGADHPRTAITRLNLALLLSDHGEIAEAKAAATRALAAFEAAYGPDHIRVAMAAHALCGMDAQVGDYARALPGCQRAVAIAEAKVGPKHVLTGSFVLELGSLLTELGRPEEAIAPLERAREIRARATTDPLKLAKAEFELARAMWDAHRDRPRALALATAARATFAAAGDHKRKDLATMTAWLESHPGPKPR